MMYSIKGFINVEGIIECRFEFILPSISEVIEFLSKVDLHEAYDYVKILPFEQEV